MAGPDDYTDRSPPVPADPPRAGNPHDTDLFTWWLSWVAHALEHTDLRFRVPLMNAPVGVRAQRCIWSSVRRRSRRARRMTG